MGRCEVFPEPSRPARVTKVAPPTLLMVGGASSFARNTTSGALAQQYDVVRLGLLEKSVPLRDDPVPRAVGSFTTLQLVSQRRPPSAAPYRFEHRIAHHRQAPQTGQLVSPACALYKDLAVHPRDPDSIRAFSLLYNVVARLPSTAIQCDSFVALAAPPRD
jgi:hypothetical protein